MQLNSFLATAILVTCVGSIVPRSAFSIGRVGNLAIGDLVQGYSAQVPIDFGQISLSDNEAVNLTSNYLLDPQYGITEFIQAVPFSLTYPNLVSANSASVLAFFQTAPQMNYAEISVSNCSLSLLGEGPNTWVGVSTWGNGNGYVLVTAKTDEAKNAIVSVLTNTEIQTPCWK